MILMPNTATTNEIQRSYRKIFDRAKKNGPVVILTNNQPDVVIISPKEFDEFYQTKQEQELADALDSIRVYQKEKGKGTLKPLKTLADLM